MRNILIDEEGDNYGTMFKYDTTDKYICKEDNISKIECILKSLYEFIEYKNAKYGSSVTDPVSIFSDNDPYTLMKIRIDDKLSRIKNSEELKKNDVVDLIGYLLFICVHNEWYDFKEMFD